jgi:1,4-dihydroxy-6-naphthoate synthase
VKIIDFGEQWEQVMHHPIPLGTIIARRDIGIDTARKVSRIIRRSIEYAYAHTDEAMPYIRQYARELSDEVIKSHIGLYVNEFSIDLGAEGKEAITFLYQKAKEVGMIDEMPREIFLE